MQITVREVGYTVYARLEETLRAWVRERLLNFGTEWQSRIPKGVWDKVLDRSSISSFDKIDEPGELLEETDLPDIVEIVCYKNGFATFSSHANITQDIFQKRIQTIYEIRNKIAHIKKSFTTLDLNLLIDIINELMPLIDEHASEVKETIETVKHNPSKVKVAIPASFFIYEDAAKSWPNNLQELDYNSDGGFVGRKEEFKKIATLLTSDLDRVITIAGAGGVGKTALAHRVCTSLLEKEKPPFDALIWISAKDDRLTLTGIESIDPMIRSYEEVLNSILDVCGWSNEIDSKIEKKEELVELILKTTINGILLVVDNLETIKDDRILEFIKDIPRPNKVLITSRIGLGEVERRYSLKELNKVDAITLIRTLARDKGINSLAKLPDELLYKYAQQMSCYPLVIKWVIGQVALGKDLDLLVQTISSTSGDIAKFCFEFIYDQVLHENARIVLCCLAASDTPLTRGILTHISGLKTEDLDEAVRLLVLASLVISEPRKGDGDTVITVYSLLPLTYAYLKSKLQSNPDLWRTIQDRMSVIGRQIEEAEKASIHYKYALQDLGATTDEERIAASWANTAYQLFQAGNYVGAIERFKRAVEIAPNFSRLYRNWATVESAMGYQSSANELMTKATKLSPSDPSLWLTWGNLERRQSHFEQARTYLRKALALSPNDGVILAALAEVEKWRSNYAEADQLFRKALSATPESIGGRHEVITLTSSADNLCRWADQLHKNAQNEAAFVKATEAFEQINRASSVESRDARVLETKRDIAFQTALIISEIRDINDALPFFDKAIIVRPTKFKDKKLSIISCYYAAQKLAASGRIDEAKKYFLAGEKIYWRDKDLREKYRERYERLRTKLSR
jgi:LuxR family glucitol operon transcriptional activator